MSRNRMTMRTGALARVEWKNRSWPVVPGSSILYLVLFLLATSVLLVTVERWWLPGLEKQRLLESADWEDETERINSNLRTKLDGRPDPVWQTAGVPAQPASDGLTILVMGDSFGWGAALANANDIWWMQLERVLHERGFSGVHVISANANGASTRDQLDMARVVVPRYDPDLIIWGYVTNDPDEDAIPQLFLRADQLQERDQLDLVLEIFSRELPLLGYKLQKLRAQRKAIELSSESNGYFYDQWELELLRPENLDLYRKTLSEVAAFHELTSIPGFFVTLPTHPDARYFEKRYQPIRPMIQRQGLELHDLLPAMLRRFGGSDLPALSYFATPNDRHPGPMVTRFYAEEVATILQREYRKLLEHARAGRADDGLRVNDWMPADMKLTEHESGRYQLEYFDASDRLLRMPEGEPYLQLSLERPRRLRAIEIESQDLGWCRLAVTTIGVDGFDSQKPQPLHLLSENDGKCVFDAPDLTVNTVRIFAGAVDKSDAIVERVLTEPFERVGEFGWRAEIPDLAGWSDPGVESKLELYEDGVPLGPARALHSDIFKLGRGRYSHWKEYVYFSTSDGSDPNTSGRRYALKLPISRPVSIQVNLEGVAQ